MRFYELMQNAADPAQRMKRFGEAQRQVAEDAVAAFLYQPQWITVARAGLKGLWTRTPLFANDLVGAGLGLIRLGASPVRWRPGRRSHKPPDAGTAPQRAVVRAHRPREPSGGSSVAIHRPSTERAFPLQ